MLFLSHTWQEDDLSRDTHKRVSEVKDELRSKGMPVWFDEDHMANNIDACMASGIERSSAVVVFITRQYCKKVDRAAAHSDVYDNCYKEFTYAMTMRKIIIPVVFEESMRAMSSWSSGIVRMHLGSKMLILAHDYTPEETADAILEMYRRLQRLSERESGPQRPAPVLTAPSARTDSWSASKEVQVTPSLTNDRRPNFHERRPYLARMWC